MLPSEPITVSVVMCQMIMGEGVVMVVFVFSEVVGGGGDLGVQPIIVDISDLTKVLWKTTVQTTIPRDNFFLLNFRS